MIKFNERPHVLRNGSFFQYGVRESRLVFKDRPVARRARRERAVSEDEGRRCTTLRLRSCSRTEDDKHDRHRYKDGKHDEVDEYEHPVSASSWRSDYDRQALSGEEKGSHHGQSSGRKPDEEDEDERVSYSHNGQSSGRKKKVEYPPAGPPAAQPCRNEWPECYAPNLRTPNGPYVGYRSMPHSPQELQDRVVTLTQWNREQSTDSDWSHWDQSSVATYPDSEQRHNTKSPRRDDDSDGHQGGWKRQKSDMLMVGEWKAKKKGREANWETDTCLKRARQDERQKMEDGKTRQISSKATYQGQAWREGREASGRSTGWSSSASWDEQGDQRKWWDAHQHQWNEHAYEMAKERKAKGEDKYVVVKKAWEEYDTRPYACNHKLVTKEEAKAEYDPPDQPGDKERLVEALQAAGATTTVKETEQQPQVVEDIGENSTLDGFTGGCAHLWRLRHGYECEACDRYLTYAGTFACYTKSSLHGEHKYEMVTDVDGMVARAKGENFDNKATAKGWLMPNEAQVKLVHICIDCSEKIEFLPRAFASGKLIDSQAPMFDDCPKIYHDKTEEGGWKPNRKWRRLSALSIAPASNSERAKKINNIMDGIARNAAKNGEANMKTAEEMKKDFNEDEKTRVAKSADWVSQLTPQTGKVGGAAILYAHRCNMCTVKKLQPKRIVDEIEKRIHSGAMLAAPLKHCFWWLTIGHDFVEKNQKRRKEWAEQDMKGQGWDLTTDNSTAKWLCPVCADTHCPSTDLEDRLLTLAGMEGLLDATVPACVLARIGDYDFNKKYTYKDWPNINIEVFINLLREGVLLKEIDGRPLNGNTTILEAIGTLHEKAQTFFKAHFADKIVTFAACDFRLDPKTDRSGRVAICEDSRLSLQHAGQDVPAILLDVTECDPLKCDELIDILITLSSFYDTSKESPTQSQKKVLNMLEDEVPARRAQIASNMDHKALVLGTLGV